MPKWGSLVQVPQSLPQYCSKHLLVMEYLEGVKLVDGIRAQYRKLAESTGTTLEQMEAERNEAIRRGTFTFQTLEQSRVERQRMQWYCALNDYVLNPNNLWKLCFNYSAMRLFYEPYELERTAPQLDLSATLELLCKVHGNEIFEHGEKLMHSKLDIVSVPIDVCAVVVTSAIDNSS